MNNFIFQQLILFFLFPKLLFNCISEFSDCFNCSVCGSKNKNLKECLCNWNTNTNTCTDISIQKNLIYSFEAFSQCNDTQSNKLQEIYCGSQELNIENELEFEMTKINNAFGIKSIYCNYKLIISEDNNIYYNIEYKYISEINEDINDIHLFLEVIYDNLTSDIIQLENENINSDLIQVKSIELKIYFEREFTELPFSLKIKELNYDSSSVLFIILGIVLGFFIMAGIICYLTKKMSDKERQRRHEMFELELNRHRGERVDAEVLQRKKLEYKNKLKVLFFLKQSSNINQINKVNILKEGKICSICLEKIQLRTKISQTPCQHIFHYKCLSNWLFKDLHEPKCPNCKYDLIKNVTNDDIYGVSIINEEGALRSKRFRLNSAGLREVNSSLSNNNNLNGVNQMIIKLDENRSVNSKNTVDDSPNTVRFKDDKSSNNSKK